MYTSILLPIDTGHESSWEKAGPVAVRIAQEEGAKIHVMTVIPDFGMSVVGSFFPSNFADDALKAAETELEKIAADIVPQDLLDGTSTVSGTIYKRILVKAEELGADLIVLASHRPEKADYLLGPNAARVVRHANCSVFVVR
jgi:nucleotide-binding universal stress UspA family protein